MTFNEPQKVLRTKQINVRLLNMQFQFNKNKGWHNACNARKQFY